MKASRRRVSGSVDVLAPGVANTALPLPALTSPLPLLLASGGDDRLQVALDTGQNIYGCEPQPKRGVLTFASSTATTVSTRAYACASRAQAELLNASLSAGLDDAFETRLDGVRREIKDILDVSTTGAEIVLCPSGTDATLHALFVTLNLFGGPLTNIIVGADETGSGVALAASGRHFSNRTALGACVEKSARALETEAPIFNCAIPLRDGTGRRVAADDMDRAVLAAVGQEVAGGRKVLLHAMDCSKTGARAPSDACLAYVASTWPSSVQIVVDACQARTTTARLRHNLTLGHLVLVTGSKFFTGPPFSGALLLPPRLVGAMAALRPMSGGLQIYSARSNWPLAWHGVRSALMPAMNFGAWLRWEASLDEMRAFDAVPDAFRSSALRAFGTAVHAASSSACLELLPDDDAAAADARSIFPFILRRDGRALSPAECKGVYQALNQDLSSALGSEPAEARAVAARLCHIGQPVALNDALGEPTAALRISASARLASRAWIAGDEALSRRNFDRELAKIAAVVEKIEFLAWRHDLGGSA